MTFPHLAETCLELAEELERVEWRAEFSGHLHCCPDCTQSCPNHAEDCKLGALLKAWRENRRGPWN